MSFALILVMVPPLALSAVELLVGLVSEPARRVVHLGLVTLLLALIFIQTLKKSVHAADVVLVVLALAIGALATLAYARAAPVRSFMNVLSPVPLVFLFLFLAVSPVSKVAFASDATARNVGGVSRANLVVVLFDEFPVSSLMDRTGHVDAKRYPAFAELERTSTWFRNAYTVYDSTERAQPAIFDGDYPRQGQAPHLRRPPQQHLHAVRQDPPPERLRGGHERLPARPLQGRARRRVLRRPHGLDGGGPGLGLAARGGAARRRGRPALGVGELGQLRRWRRRPHRRGRGG